MYYIVLPGHYALSSESPKEKNLGLRRKGLDTAGQGVQVKKKLRVIFKMNEIVF